MTSPSAAAIAVPPPMAVPLESLRRERAQAVQKLQHAVPAAALLYAGLTGLRQGVQGFAYALSWAEIVFSALLLRTLVLSARQAFAARPSESAAAEHAAHGGVDWSEIFAGAVLLVEAAERWHTHGHLPRPTVLVAFVTIGLGLMHARVARRARNRRMLALDADGLEVRWRFRRFAARWEEIARFEIGERAATLETRRGATRRLDFTDLRHAEAVRALLTEARARWSAAIAVAESGPAPASP